MPSTSRTRTSRAWRKAFRPVRPRWPGSCWPTSSSGIAPDMTTWAAEHLHRAAAWKWPLADVPSPTSPATKPLQRRSADAVSSPVGEGGQSGCRRAHQDAAGRGTGIHRTLQAGNSGPVAEVAFDGEIPAVPVVAMPQMTMDERKDPSARARSTAFRC